MGNLASRPQGRELLFNSGAVSQVQPLLNSPAQAVQRQALFVLAQLSGGNAPQIQVCVVIAASFLVRR